MECRSGAESAKAGMAGGAGDVEGPDDAFLESAGKDMKGRASGEGLGWHSAAGGCCNQEFEAQPWFAAFGELCFFDL